MIRSSVPLWRLIKKTKCGKEKSVMCRKLKPKNLSTSQIGGLVEALTNWRSAMSAVALAVLCSLSVNRASAQVCVACPAPVNGQNPGPASGAGNRITVIRNGIEVDVTRQIVGACEVLTYHSDVSYA